jgi:hypothetical protein
MTASADSQKFSERFAQSLVSTTTLWVSAASPVPGGYRLTVWSGQGRADITLEKEVCEQLFAREAWAARRSIT